MKRLFWKRASIMGLVAGIAVMPGLASASETFTYTGNAAERQTIDSRVNSIGPTNLTNITGNIITVNYTPNGSNDVSNLYGGYANFGNVSGNTANLSNGTVSNNIFGGYANNGNVTNNRVYISGGTAQFAVYGAYANIG